MKNKRFEEKINLPFYLTKDLNTRKRQDKKTKYEKKNIKKIKKKI